MGEEELKDVVLNRLLISRKLLVIWAKIMFCSALGCTGYYQIYKSWVPKHLWSKLKKIFKDNLFNTLLSQQSEMVFMSNNTIVPIIKLKKDFICFKFY